MRDRNRRDMIIARRAAEYKSFFIAYKSRIKTHGNYLKVLKHMTNR